MRGFMMALIGCQRVQRFLQQIQVPAQPFIAFQLLGDARAFVVVDGIEKKSIRCSRMELLTIRGMRFKPCFVKF